MVIREEQGTAGAAAFAVIPLLDCLAIGFTREAGGAPFNVLSMMLAFPVIWLSAQVRPYMPALAIAGTILSAVVPPAVQGSPPAGESMIRTLILPLVMSVIALTSHVVATTIRRQGVRLIQNEQTSPAHWTKASAGRACSTPS